MGTKPIIHPIDLHVGNYFRTSRLQSDRSNKHVARSLGVSMAELERMESGIQRILAERLRLLCELFAVTPKEVFRDLAIAA